MYVYRHHSTEFYTDVNFQYDVDHDGRISLRELRALIYSGGCGADIPRHAVKTILKKSDLDNSGHLDLEEFIIMVHQVENQNYFSHLTQKYVKFIVPSRKGVHYVDATGIVFILSLTYSTFNITNILYIYKFKI